MHLADAFIQSDLQLHSGYTFSLVHEYIISCMMYSRYIISLHGIYNKSSMLVCDSEFNSSTISLFLVTYICI